ncbi:LysR family transcriptional regulator [Pelagibius sp. Alg239-R121]|uniref:LysR family transcriptional regulator n=1 Tax=Pelagibius sp. Alg239-R121 TaxID=2993448 RepID=UPI0024A78775|nr:LysR family transcriptional regulator [Pelagibius sp. Alg239-R121]
MNIAALRTFLAIVETGNLIRAAEKLNVTQSTVTARLKSLENDLGQKLFHRRKSGAELTSPGFKFQRYAQVMTDLWRQAQQETSLPPEIQAICNIGCHIDLWPALGRTTFDEIRQRSPSTALSAWPGEQGDLDKWLGTGLVDAALCYAPSVHENQTATALCEERLLLVSTEPRALMRWDPNYIYVDSGEDFRRRHAETYADSETPSVTFGCAVWALEYLLDAGGSAYLPERLVEHYIAEKALHPVPDAPSFSRRVYLVINDRAGSNWPWLQDLVSELAA